MVCPSRRRANGAVTHRNCLEHLHGLSWIKWPNNVSRTYLITDGMTAAVSWIRYSDITTDLPSRGKLILFLLRCRHTERYSVEYAKFMHLLRDRYLGPGVDYRFMLSLPLWDKECKEVSSTGVFGRRCTNFERMFRVAGSTKVKPCSREWRRTCRRRTSPQCISSVSIIEYIYLYVINCISFSGKYLIVNLRTFSTPYCVLYHCAYDVTSM